MNLCSMSPATINILVTSFDGLGLPPTLALPVLPSMTLSVLKLQIISRLHPTNTRLILTTTSNKEIGSSSEPVSSLLASSTDDFLPIRLSVPLCGGKGGFGSQLRAAGGRMSSMRKRNRGDDNGSSRNLDGRRLRTVNEAKALAEYLAVKPEMDKKQKEVRRKRWEQVVEVVEKREAEIKSGSKGKVNGQWAEDKDEAGERTREAVMGAMKSGNYTDNSFASLHRKMSETANDRIDIEVSDQGEVLEIAAQESSSPVRTPSAKSTSMKHSFFGFNDDDNFMSESSGDEDDSSDEGKATENSME